ncbi:energy-coupling factor ABC transporter ATP-binding protein [Desulfosudis oleivorans]|uniref:ABC transporter-related protein n=1 Tax=Desulfosudis oleivorans (strain DSM 6200 / JCM 39069 / Hxd3) TaxID=96561 RepID=A8ZWV1_DESOH|nr:ABC transporter ATP-binding protein [Desulfosudis oleivorans]ABW68432.1 ABC transporter-related protein [Desulfosudis oleivorans Hxd3]
MSSVIYRVSDLVYAYDSGPRVLEVPELEITRGTVTGLVGPNGSGKTTLLKLLAFVQKPVAGEIRFKGRPASTFSEHVRFAVTFLPQTPYLLKRSVYGNIAYGLRLRGVTTEDMDRRIERALALVGLPFDVCRRRPDSLSGGQAQRVALAARLALEPEVLLLDEPTASVDVESARLIQEAVLAARQVHGTTVVVASHDLQWMHAVSDRMLQMYNGRVWEAGSKNVVPGPWHSAGEGRWEKHLPGGQRIHVPAPPVADASALIEFGLAKTPTAGAGLPTLSGKVTHLVLEPKRQTVAVTVTVDRLTLTVRVADHEVEQHGLLPGKRIPLFYNPGTIVFL